MTILIPSNSSLASNKHPPSLSKQDLPTSGLQVVALPVATQNQPPCLSASLDTTNAQMLQYQTTTGRQTLGFHLCYDKPPVVKRFIFYFPFESGPGNRCTPKQSSSPASLFTRSPSSITPTPVRLFVTVINLQTSAVPRSAPRPQLRARMGKVRLGGCVPRDGKESFE